MTTKTIISAQWPIVKAPGDDDTYLLDMTNIVGSRTVSSATVSATSGLTVGATGTVNTSVETDTNPLTGEAISVAVGKGVKVTMSGGTASTDYVVTVTATLSDSAVAVGVFHVEVRSQ